MNMNQQYFLLITLLFLYFCPEKISARRHTRRMKSYSGYQVYQLYNSNLANVARLEEVYDQLNVDVWHGPSSFSNKSVVMVSGKKTKKFQKTLEEMGLHYKIQIENVQTLIAQNMKKERKRFPRNERTFRFDQYHTYSKILQWMKRFASASENRKLVSLLRVGTTYEGRTIFGLRISLTKKHTTKHVIWQDSLIHAREWITGATLLWITNQLVADYKANDSLIAQFLKNFDFVFVPVWNVDGYIHSWRFDRLWRKSRRRNGFNLCNGVDLNRNFETPNLNGVHFCSAVYPGLAPFSEPETETVARYLRKLKLAAYITIHSFFELWMYPYGYKESPSADHGELAEVSSLAVQALNLVHNSTYNHGSIHNSAYMVAGGSIDWVYDSLCVKHAYAVELRDKGEHGFCLPPEQIVPTAEEYYAGLKEIVKHLLTARSFRSSTCACRRKSATVNQFNCTEQN